MNSQNTLFKAIEFANWAHRDQKRKLENAPYVVHPFHIMILLLTHGVNPEDQEGLTVLTAGALHDTLEDNPEEVTLALLEKEFGSDVARVVKGVTLDPSNPDKRLSRQKILRTDWMTRIVKVADILSNTMSTTDPIKKLGFEEVQKNFRQPISDKVDMECAFLIDVCREGDPRPLFAIRASATEALEELETISRNNGK